tara:strand:+ start:801 stop:2099 length:1299 start_codon:yes stop_codon:yes gene_type:complete
MSLIIENGDCLELMKSLPDNSVDLFICDLPYGETNCKWDSKIDLEQFWEQFRRLRKSKRTACIHFCSTKFGYTLIKSWEGGYKMDMVWKKRNKTGGLQSRHRPMRNHEMVYFFYEQAPKYNRDKYHKRIQTQNVGGGKNEHGFDCKGQSNHGEKSFEPPNPASVMEEKDTIYNKNTIGWSSSENNKTYLKQNPGYEPRQPGSVVEEEDTMFGETKKKRKERYKKNGTGAMNPPNPASVMEEEDPWGKKNGGDKGAPFGLKYDPPNPASVMEEDAESKNEFGWDKAVYKKKAFCSNFDPPNPASVVEGDPRVNEKGKSAHGWDINHMDKPRVAHFEPKLPLSVVIPAEDEPVSMFESTKVFIGKRHHQTEKPQDILEFFIKYWTDEGDTILDPTMGSGSTGVACNKLKRNFIGFELDETIFKVAEKRVNTKVI